MQIPCINTSITIKDDCNWIAVLLNILHSSHVLCLINFWLYLFSENIITHINYISATNLIYPRGNYIFCKVIKSKGGLIKNRLNKKDIIKILLKCRTENPNSRGWQATLFVARLTWRPVLIRNWHCLLICLQYEILPAIIRNE